MAKLIMELDDPYTDQQMKMETRLSGVHIDCYIDAFRAFLLAIGFHADLVKERLVDDNQEL